MTPWKTGPDGYADFVVWVRKQPNGTYRSFVLEAPAGMLSETELVPPLDRMATDQLLARLEAQARADARSAGSAPRADFESDPPDAAPPERPEDIGGRLHKRLLTGAVRQAYLRSLERVRRAGLRGLRLRLVFGSGREQPDYLAALPWELLCPPETPNFLVLGERTQVVRELHVPEPAVPTDIHRSLRILIAIAQPKDQDPLDLAPEVRALRESVVQRRDALELELYEHARLDGLRERLREGRFHGFHFMGHGRFGRDLGVGELLFEGRDGNTDRVSGRWLATNLRDLEHLRFVVLNACETASMPLDRGADPFLGAAAALLMAGLPAVVAMQLSIPDRAAIAFSAGFYEALGQRGTLERAVYQGRLRMYNQGRGHSMSWATPALFRNPVAQTTFRPIAGDGSTQLPSKRPPRIGVRSMLHLIERMEELTDTPPLDLHPFFAGRTVRRADDWNNAIWPRLRDYLHQQVREHRDGFQLQLDTHTSIAFAAGYALNVKLGLKLPIAIRQRTAQWGVVRWAADEGTTGDPPTWLPIPEPEARGDADPSPRDLIVGVSVSQPVLGDVEAYVAESEVLGQDGPPILHASLGDAIGQASVRSGGHAFQLAQQLCNQLERHVKATTGGCTVHLFIAAPNVVTFHLGRLAQGLGAVQLYEYDFDHPRRGAYTPAIALDPAAVGFLRA